MLLLLYTIFICLTTPIWGNEKDHPFSILQQLIFRECNEITEINRQASGFSDIILSSLSKKSEPSKYLSISVNNLRKRHLEYLSSYAKNNGIDFSFWRINESYIEIEPTDLLIINSLETYHHLHFALNTFEKNVRKYICIPNMYKNNEPYEREENYRGDYLEYPNPIPSNSQGVWHAVRDFLDAHPEWTIIEPDTSGMLVLFRLYHTFPPTSFQFDPRLDYYLKNKIILCTGPSLGRYQMLKDNIETELDLIPYKKIFVRTNDEAILNIKFSKTKLSCERIPCIEKYTDCWNCIISSLKDAVNDLNVCDDDIILFKHESVFLNDLNLFKQAISKLLEGSDMVVRTFFGGSTSDIFLVKVSAIRNLIQNFSILTNIPNDTYVEMMFHSKIATKIPRVYCLHLGMAPFSPTNVSTWGSNALGFYHYHKYFVFSTGLNEFIDTFGQKFWKKENYFSVFNENYDITEHKYYTSLTELLIDFLKINNQ